LEWWVSVALGSVGAHYSSHLFSAEVTVVAQARNNSTGQYFGLDEPPTVEPCGASTFQEESPRHKANGNRIRSPWTVGGDGGRTLDGVVLKKCVTKSLQDKVTMVSRNF